MNTKMEIAIIESLSDIDWKDKSTYERVKEIQEELKGLYDEDYLVSKGLEEAEKKEMKQNEN